MHKVYLLSSNQASQEDIATVTNRLKQLNVEIVTDHKVCQSLIILPGKLNREKIIIGKGIYTKTKEFTESYSKTNPAVAVDSVYVITYLPDYDNDSLWVSNIYGWSIIDETDWTRYGSIEIVKNSARNIKSVFSTRKEREDTVREYNSNLCDEIPIGFPICKTQSPDIPLTWPKESVSINLPGPPIGILAYNVSYSYIEPGKNTIWKNSKWKNLLIG